MVSCLTQFWHRGFQNVSNFQQQHGLTWPGEEFDGFGFGANRKHCHTHNVGPKVPKNRLNFVQLDSTFVAFYTKINHTSAWFQLMWMLLLFNLIPQLLHFIQNHNSAWFQFMWMLILFNLIPQLLHFIQNSTTLLYGFNSC